MEHSETNWLQLMKRGDADAVSRLWERYFHRLIALARKKLAVSAKRVADEEDVAISAFHSFCRGAAAEKFDRLADRDDLWQVLAMLTSRKAARQLEKERAAKRGGGKVRGESALLHGDETWSSGFQNAATGGPSPEFEAMINDEFERLMEVLPDDSLRQIVMAKLEGYTNAETAEQLGKHVRSIERKLQMIRKYWVAEDPSQ